MFCERTLTSRVLIAQSWVCRASSDVTKPEFFKVGSCGTSRVELSRPSRCGLEGGATASGPEIFTDDFAIADGSSTSWLTATAFRSARGDRALTEIVGVSALVRHDQ